MIVRKAFRFCLEPMPEQTHVMARVAECMCFVWNKDFTEPDLRHLWNYSADGRKAYAAMKRPSWLRGQEIKERP